MTFNWATYLSATGCTKYGPAGVNALMTYLEDRFPAQFSMGVCNCRLARGSTSWSHHAECRAYDQGHTVSVDGGKLAVATLELLGPHGARLGIDHMIVNHNPTGTGRGDARIYSAKAPSGRVYTGVHPHKDHNHIGLTRSAGVNLSYGTLVSVLGGVVVQPGGDEDMYGLAIGKVGAPVVTVPRVKALQLMLQQRGENIGSDGADGRAGNDTRNALISFQKKNKIVAPELESGTIGDHTYAALYKP